MNYFNKNNKQLIVLSSLSSMMLLLLANVFSNHSIISNLLLNLCASLITATVALVFVGYIKHLDAKAKIEPARSLAKSSIETSLYGTLLDLGHIYGFPLEPREILKAYTENESENGITKLVKNLKSIKYVKNDLDYDLIPKSLQADAQKKINEIDQVMQLYSFALPLEIRSKLVQVRSDYRDVDLILSIYKSKKDLTKSAKTVTAVLIHKLKISVVSLYQLMNSVDIKIQSNNLVDE